MNKLNKDCICIISLLLAAGLTGLVIWFWNTRNEGYIHFNRYRPDNKYRHQYWWKRPFLRYPYSFIKPSWQSVYYDQQPLETNKELPRIIPKLGSSFSITFDMLVYPAMTEDDQLLFRVGEAYPSPMMVYSPIDNTLTMILYTHFDGYIKKIIYVDNFNSGEWNNVTWIQKGQWMTVNINGVEKLKVNVGSIPKISSGTFYMEPNRFIRFRNLKVCDYSLK